MSLPPIRFAILAAPRTGSNWLCSLLDSHPEVLCHHELFNPAGIHLALSRRGTLDPGSIAERDRDPAAFLSRLWPRSFGCRAVGFKITREQPAAVFEAVFADSGIRVVVLERHNRLRTLVSERIARQTGLWESYRAAAPEREPPRVAVTREELEAYAAKNERYYAWLAERLCAAGHRVLGTTYERLPNIKERQRILAFLGVDPLSALTTATLKQGSRELRERIVNFDTLTRDLRGTPFAAELEAPEL